MPYSSHNLGRITSLLVVLALVIASVPAAQAQSTSTSFRNISESVNCGGAMSSSTSFKLMDSNCEGAVGTGTSASFANVGGFEAMEDLPRITFTLSGNSISFGTLTTAAVASGSITTNVKTNALSGYTTSIATDGAFRITSGADINAVSDGTVTAGSEEYGVRTSGADGLLNSADTGISTTAINYASNSGPSDVTTTLTFKAAVAPTTSSGNYSQTVYLVATGRF